MSQQNNPTIDSGVVHAPSSTDPRYPTNTSSTTTNPSQTQAAPSQATTSTNPFTSHAQPIPASSQSQQPTSGESVHPNPRATRKSNPMMRAGEAVAGGPVPERYQHGNVGGNGNGNGNLGGGNANVSSGNGGTGHGPVHYGQTGVSEWGNGGAPVRYDGLANSAGSGTGNGVSGNGNGNADAAETGNTGTGTTTGNGIGNSTTGTGHRVGGATTSEHGNGNTVDNRTTSEKVKESASGVKGLVAAVHGVGETLRGEFNAGVDGLVGDKSGEAKNKNIARAGEAEVQTGKFGSGTKNREGVVPGSDGERRNNQAF